MKQITQNNSLSTEEVEERLDEHVDAVPSSRRTAEQPAMELSKLRRDQQEFVLHWVTAAAQTHAEMAYQFAAKDIGYLSALDYIAQDIAAHLTQADSKF